MGSALVDGLPTPDELVADFDVLDGWEDRYAYLIDLGERLPRLPEEERTEANRVPGCASRVWLVRRASEDGTLAWEGDSDSSVVRGLVAVLRVLCGGRTPGEVLALDVGEAFARLGLERHLSAGRRNGFASMVSRLRGWAR